MKAIIQDRYGSADVLRLEDVERPAIGDEEVLVRIRAASLDPGVWHVMTGQPYLIRLMGFGLRGPKIRVRGTDLAGEVAEVGSRVDLVRPGDEIFGGCYGSFAEYARAPQDKLAPKPPGVTFEKAAAIPSSGITALQALRARARLEPGQSVLVIGASGGVGSFAVQIAKALGAEVTGVASGAKLDLVRSLGADRVIDYAREDFADGRGRWDVIVDTAGNRKLSRLRRALTPRGALVLIGGEEGGALLGGIQRHLAATLASPFTRQRLIGMFASGSRAELEFLGELVESGRVTPVIERTRSLADVPEEIRRWERGHATGKVVFRVA